MGRKPFLSPKQQHQFIEINNPVMPSSLDKDHVDYNTKFN